MHRCRTSPTAVALAVLLLAAGTAACAILGPAPPLAQPIGEAVIGGALDALDNLEIKPGANRDPLWVDPPTLTFGIVPVGATRTRAFAIRNATTSRVVIADILVSGRFFAVSVPRLPVTLEAGQRMTAASSFAPVQPCLCRGRLRIVMSEPDRRLDVSLTARGEARPPQQAPEVGSGPAYTRPPSCWFHPSQRSLAVPRFFPGFSQAVP